MSADAINVLVLGAGSNVSQGILKALALSKLPCNVIAAGVHPMDFGLHTGHRAYLCPWATDPAFMDWLLDTCRKERIHAILSGAETVVDFLTEHASAIQRDCGAMSLVSRTAVHAIGKDKLGTCHWLEQHGFRAPESAMPEDEPALTALVTRHAYPFVAKPRFGGGSRGLIWIRDDIDLDYIRKRPGYVVQECVGTEDQEYTVGCFCDRDGKVRGTIVMRRELQDGATVRAIACDHPLVEDASRRIVETLKPTGPCNVQCRVADGDVVCFEMNIRFSGTTPLRARLGFNEVEAALRHYVLGEAACDLPRITRGMAVRYLNELYLDPAACEDLSTEGFLRVPEHYPSRLETYGNRP
ncbi:MAG: carbamoyl phosphate synthase [Candidatus Hydrogenedentota bacterium]